MKVYGDQISGNCLKVKYVADYLSLSYEWVETGVLAGDAKTKEFLMLNPVGQIPVIQLSNGNVLAQSNAIMLYLAKGSDLIPQNAWQEAKMNEWLFWEQYSHETAIAVTRFQVVYKGVAFEKVDPVLINKSYVALDIMEQHLTDGTWFVGGSITLADVALYAYTQFAESIGFDMRRYQAIEKWLRRVKETLNL